MYSKDYCQQAENLKFVTITKADAIRVVEALVLVFGIIPLQASAVLRHRAIFDFASIRRFAPDELVAAVNVALKTTLKTQADEEIPVQLDYEVRRVFGELPKALWFKIGNGHYEPFASCTAAA